MLDLSQGKHLSLVSEGSHDTVATPLLAGSDKIHYRCVSVSEIQSG